MDVHPPLAKMLIALTGWLAGFDGKFDFKEIGKDYIEPGVPYVAMRMFPALCGVLLAPFMFLTLKTVGCRTMTAAMGSGLIIFGASHSLAISSSFVMANRDIRERPAHSSSTDPARLAPCLRHWFHCSCIQRLHQPT